MISTMMQTLLITALKLKGSGGVAYCHSTSYIMGSTTLAQVKDAIPTTPVVVVSKSYCPYCRRAKNILDSYAIEAGKIKIFEIENEPDMNEIQSYMAQITGARSVPRIFIGGQSIGGGDDIAKLHSAQKLNQILTSSGAL